MDRHRIISYVDQLFDDVPKTKRVLEQKEELQSNMEERIADYMESQIPFEDAFQKAKDDLGDVGELKNEFRNAGSGHKKKKKRKGRFKGYKSGRFAGGYTFTALAPFIYIAMGFLIPGWQIWAIGWIIIPVSGMLESAISHKNLAALVGITPFIYVGLGILIGGWFWAWGWVIIPIAGILFGYRGPKVTVDYDEDNEEAKKYFDHNLEEIEEDRKN